MQAKMRVELWLNAQVGLPAPCEVVRQSETSRFKIVWKHPSYGMSFTLFNLKVRACGTVRVVDDLTLQVAASLVQNPEGFAREKRVFDALLEHTADTPVWFIHARRSAEFYDRRGVDGFIRAIVGNSTPDLPFQIKSSKGSSVRFYEKYPEYKGIVPVVRVEDRMSADTLRHRVYSAIGAVRAQVAAGQLNMLHITRTIHSAVRTP
jgi:hypothetical protein